MLLGNRDGDVGDDFDNLVHITKVVVVIMVMGNRVGDVGDDYDSCVGDGSDGEDGALTLEVMI
jgi:hypothetical protein